MNDKQSTKRSRMGWLVVGLLAGLLALSVVSCGATSELADLTTEDAVGSTSIDAIALDSTLQEVTVGELTAAEAEGLIFMREEEKLARDVYLTLYDQWGLSLFQNIANSEQTHTDAVKTLLDRYGLDDPMTNRVVGEFENDVLQALYDDLVAAGSESLGDALKVGAAIEEIDILDLEKYMAQTDKADILTVYENLTKGSRNHLRSFTSTLARQTGEIYEPQYMSQQAYDEIVDAELETGGNGRGRGRGK